MDFDEAFELGLCNDCQHDCGKCMKDGVCYFSDHGDNYVETVHIVTDLTTCNKEQLISALGAVVNAVEDEAYGYDLVHDFVIRIKEALYDSDINAEIKLEDIYQ